MSETSQIIQTNTGDLDRISSLIVGNSTTKLRTALAMAQRRILNLQQILIELRAHQSVVKGRIYNNYEQTYIEQNLSAGQLTKAQPQNSYDLENISPPPDHAVSSIIFKAYNEDGNQALNAELNKINNDILYVEANLRKYSELSDKIEKQIEAAENQKDKQQTLIEKATGRVYPPTLDGMELDKIRKSVYTNVSLLYNLATAYRDLSVDASGKRKYPDDNSLPQKLLVMRQVFWATVQQFPNYLNETKAPDGSPQPPLDTNDPGSDQNILRLKSDLNNLKTVCKDVHTDPITDKYVRDLKSISNDVYVSRGIERKPDPTLPDSNSMNAQTKTYSMTAVRLGNLYIGSFELPSLGSAISKIWKKKNKDLYKGLPLCPNVQKPPTTSTDSKEAAAETADLELQKKGAENFQKALAAANAANSKPLGLPSDAPSWVVSWTKLYGTGPVGFIDTLVVVRTFAGTLKDAAEQAQKKVYNSYGITVGPSDIYYYAEENKSQTGSNVASKTYVYFGGWMTE